MRRTPLCFGFLVLAALILSLDARDASAQFREETVESNPSDLVCLDLVTDGTNRVHVVYHDPVSGELGYALRENGAWTTRILDVVGAEGHASIDVDTADRPNILYYDGSDLKHAWFDQGAWWRQTRDSTDDAGRFVSMQIDTNGAIHVAYEARRLGPGNLKYATTASGSWAFETVGPGGTNASLALDSSNQPRICHGSGPMLLAMKNGGTWSTETVALLTSSGPGLLDMGFGDVPVVVYPRHESTTYKMAMATRNALDDWTEVSLTVSQVESMSVEAFAFADGRNHVVYSSSKPGELGSHYLFWPRFDVLETSPLPGTISSLTVDAAGTPHLGGTIDTSLRYLTFQFREIPAPALSWVQSMSWGDYDNDGDDDLYVVRQLDNVLLHNAGGGNFEPRSIPPLNDSNDGIGSAWGDYDNDGDLDLFLINNLERNRLFRNEGQGEFTDVTPTVLGYAGNSRDVTWVDYDNDGDLDLYLACQNEPNHLYRNDGQGTFVDLKESPVDNAGPTIDTAWGDFDDDGDMDSYLVQAGSNDILLINMGGVYFDEFTYSWTTGTRLVAWVDENNDARAEVQTSLAPMVDAVRQDLDNDGWSDIYQSREADGSGYSPNLFQRNLMGQSYLPMSFGPLHQWTSGTGAVTGADFDGDGDVDLALALPGTGGIKLFLNDISERHWLKLRLKGRLSPLDGQGAKLIVRAGGLTQSRQIGGGNGYRGHDALTAHFGLGSTATVDTVEIRWPSGVVQILEGLAADTTYNIEEEGIPVVPPWSEVHSPEFTTAQLARGSSWVDYDGDNDLDLFVSHLVQLNPILRNDGSDTFTQISTAPLNTAGNPSASWGDYDNDGDMDLLAPSWVDTAPIYLFRNESAGVFTDAAVGPLTTPGAYLGGSWVDITGNGFLDAYVHKSDGSGLLLSSSVTAFYDNTEFYLGTLEDVAGYAWADYDADGDVDLFLHRSNTPNSLFRNDGIRSFTDVAAGPLRDLNQGQGGVASWSQPTWVDHDSDGDLDLHILLMTGGDYGESVLLQNDGPGTWTDVTASVLSIATLTTAQGWFDFDNDGLLDLISLGGIDDFVHHRSGPNTFDQSIILPTATGRSYSLADYDEDGDVDLFITTDTGANHLLKNNQTTGFHWLEVELQGVESNRSGLGATVRIVAGGLQQIQSNPSSGLSFSENSPRLHFGLNASATVDSIIVTWPSGFPQFLTELAADQILTVVENVPRSPLEIIGGIAAPDARGVAIGDYDNDGWEDSYTTSATQANNLWRSNGATFDQAPFGGVNDTGNSRGAAWADVDNDGDLDLYLVNKNSSNKLFENDGSGGFTDITNGTTGHTGDGRSVAWGDFDNDGLVDLYLVNALEPNLLLKNLGSGGLFTSVVNPVLNDPGDGRGTSWGDFDSDGDVDLYLANSGSPNKLLRNNGGGAFTDIATPLLADAGGRGVAWADFDNDEDLDLFVAGGSSNSALFRNLGGGNFESVVSGEISAIPGGRGVGWGDFDNDGWIDLYVVQEAPLPNVLLRNLGNGEFSQVDIGLASDDGEGRGCAWVDFDQDGALDLIVINSAELSHLIRNKVGQSRNWLRVRCVGTVSNAAAIGARVRIVTAMGPQIREVSGGSGLFSQNPLPVHFGLGSLDVVDTLEIFWPSGIVQRSVQVAGNRQLTVIEDATTTDTDDMPSASLRTRLHPNIPNPFNPLTVLRFDLASEGPAKLVIYDSMGRRVRTLHEGRLPSGRHEARWMGEDDNDRSVASGVYFARLTANEGSDVVRMVLVR